MKTILKQGTKEKPEDKIYFMRCGTCGCEFTYQKSDVCYGLDNRYICCPDCRYNCNILFLRKYKPNKESIIMKYFKLFGGKTK